MYLNNYDDEFLAQTDPQNYIFKMRDELLVGRRRIAELETAVAVLTAQRNEADKRIAELEAQLAAILRTGEAATDGDGKDYSEGCHQ